MMSPVHVTYLLHPRERMTTCLNASLGVCEYARTAIGWGASGLVMGKRRARMMAVEACLLGREARTARPARGTRLAALVQDSGRGSCWANQNGGLCAYVRGLVDVCTYEEDALWSLEQRGEETSLLVVPRVD